MNRPVMILMFIIGLLFGTGLLLAVAKTHAAGPELPWDEPTAPSLQVNPEKDLPRLSFV